MQLPFPSSCFIIARQDRYRYSSKYRIPLQVSRVKVQVLLFVNDRDAIETKKFESVTARSYRSTNPTRITYAALSPSRTRKPSTSHSHTQHISLFPNSSPKAPTKKIPSLPLCSYELPLPLHYTILLPYIYRSSLNQTRNVTRVPFLIPPNRNLLLPPSPVVFIFPIEPVRISLRTFSLTIYPPPFPSFAIGQQPASPHQSAACITVHRARCHSRWGETEGVMLHRFPTDRS